MPLLRPSECRQTRFNSPSPRETSANNDYDELNDLSPKLRVAVLALESLLGHRLKLFHPGQSVNAAASGTGLQRGACTGGPKFIPKRNRPASRPKARYKPRMAAASSFQRN